MKKVLNLSNFNVHLQGQIYEAGFHCLLSRKKEFVAKQARDEQDALKLYTTQQYYREGLYLIGKDKMTFKLARKTDLISCNNTK